MDKQKHLFNEYMQHLFNEYMRIIAEHYTAAEGIVSQDMETAGEIARYVQTIGQILYNRDVTVKDPAFMPLLYFTMGFTSCAEMVFFTQQD